jgi:FAD/FMN-containing dehydrogenase
VADGLNAWTNAVIATIAPSTPNESYQNFPNRMITDWQEEYYAENFPRLVSVKAKYDPQNLFQNAQSIPVTM